jgi:putative membrane protein insertion efficiency factor
VAFLSKTIVLCIRAYQATKRFRPATCRFYPTCSEYAAQAILQHGAAKGLLLSCLRLAKCHPFYPGGIDEVPAVCKHASPNIDRYRGTALPVRPLVQMKVGLASLTGTQPRRGGPVNS